MCAHLVINVPSTGQYVFSRLHLVVPVENPGWGVLTCSLGAVWPVRLGLARPGGGSRVRPQSWRLDPAGLAPGDASVPAQPGPGEPAAATDGLAFRVRPRRPAEPGDEPVQHAVRLSAGDLKIAQEAVALARQDSENDKLARPDSETDKLAREDSENDKRQAGPPGPQP